MENFEEFKDALLKQLEIEYLYEDDLSDGIPFDVFAVAYLETKRIAENVKKHGFFRKVEKDGFDLWEYAESKNGEVVTF